MEVTDQMELFKPELGQLMVEIEGGGTICLKNDSVYELTRFDGTKMQLTVSQDDSCVSFFAIPSDLLSLQVDNTQGILTEQTLLIGNTPTQFILDDEEAVAVPPDDVVPRKELHDEFDTIEQALIPQSNVYVVNQVESPDETQTVIRRHSSGKISQLSLNLSGPVVDAFESNEAIVVESDKQTPLAPKRGRPRKEKDVDPPIRNGPFLCSICHLQVATWPQFKSHKATHMVENKEHVCHVCFASFNVEKNLNLHMALHNVGNLTCPECCKTFTRFASFKAHLPLHEEEENVFCSECGDEFPNTSQLEQHLQEHRSEWEKEITSKDDSKKLLTCKSCNRIFTNPVSFECHKKEHQRLRTQLQALAPRRRRKRLRVTGSSTKYPNQCIVCKKSFSKPSQLTRHIRIHTGERPFKCASCPAAFSQKGSLQIHMSKHNGVKPFLCDCCSLSFSQRGNLITHVNKVHRIPKEGEEIFKCMKCSCSFKRLASLNCHITRFHLGVKADKTTDLVNSDSVSAEYNLDTLVSQLAELRSNLPSNDIDILETAIQISGLQDGGKVEGLTDNLGELSQVQAVTTDEDSEVRMVTIADKTDDGNVKHLNVRQRRVGNVRWHQCSVCQKEFKKPSDLIRHNRIHTREKPYRCHQCFRTFSIKSTLKSHLRTHEATHTHQCKICSKKVSSSRSLKIHNRSHTGLKPFSCSTCSKAFATSGQLKAHQSTNAHKQRSKFDCEKQIFFEEPFMVVGDGEFKQQMSRRERLLTRSMHASNNERPYRCEYCQLKFRKSSHVKQHRLQHTGERPYTCVICDKSFTTNGVLKMHLRTHMGQKDFGCDKCASLFSTKGSLKRHAQTFHSEERPFLCPYCQKRFKTSVNCRKHIKIHRYDVNNQFFGMKLDDVVLEERIKDGRGEMVVKTTQFPWNDYITKNQEVISQTLLADATGTVTLPTLSHDALTQESIRELEQTLNQQLFGNSEAAVIVEKEPQFTQSMILNLHQPDPEPSIVQTVFAQVDELQTVSNMSDILPETNSTIKNTSEEVEGAVAEPELSEPSGTKKKQLLRCDSCSFTTRSEVYLKRHINKHVDETVFQCPECPFIFRRELQLRRHEKCHASTKVETTRVVRRSKAPFIELSDAETEYYAAQDAKQSASVSEVILIASAAEKLRIKDGNKTDRMDDWDEDCRSNFGNRCQYCDKTFRKPSDLVRHIRVHTGERPYQCPQCSKCFTVKSTLSSHLRTHFGGAKPVSCHICQSMFAARSSLKVHMRLHTGVKPFQCPLCGQKFRTSGHKKNHMTSHTKLKPKTWKKQQLEMLNNIAVALVDNFRNDDEQEVQIKQDRVGLQVFNDETIAGIPQQLPLHSTFLPGELTENEEDLVAKDPNSGVKEKEDPIRFEIYAADGQVYNITTPPTQEPDLVLYHKEEENSKQLGTAAEVREVEGVKIYRCKVCDKEFPKHSLLQRHIRVHTGERPYACDICGKRFTQSNSLEVHLRAHRGERSHACPYCDFSCVQKGNLRVHISRTHLAYYLDREKHTKSKDAHGRGHKSANIGSLLGDPTLDGADKARSSDLDQVMGELFPEVNPLHLT